MNDDGVTDEQIRNQLLHLNEQERQFLTDFIVDMGEDELHDLLDSLLSRIANKDYSRKVLVYRLALLKIGEIMEAENLSV